MTPEELHGEGEFLNQAHQLTKRFKDRGYPRKIVSQAFHKTNSGERKELLTARQKVPNTDLRIITAYNNQWTDVRNILTKYWGLLKSDVRVGSTVMDRPLLMARRAPNLRDKLTRSHFSRPHRPVRSGGRVTGSFPCSECSVCSHLAPTKVFINPIDCKNTH